MTSYLTSMDTISPSRTVLEIFDFTVFRVWPLKVFWGQKVLYHSKAHIWLPIWLLWTPSLYLIPFSRYLTFKFLGFDLNLWPLKVIWGQKYSYHSKAHIWFPIWLLWTTSLYLVPFSRYLTPKAHIWLSKVIIYIWFSKSHISHIYLYIWLSKVKVKNRFFLS